MTVRPASQIQTPAHALGAILVLVAVGLAACATAADVAPSSRPSATPPGAQSSPDQPPLQLRAAGIPLGLEEEAALRHELATALIDEQAWSEALDHISWLRKHRSSWWSVQLQYAQVSYTLTADSADALAALERSVALKPVNPRALLLMGQIYEDLAEPQKATLAYRQVLKWRPDDLQATYRLARLLHRQGALDEAAELLGAVLDKSEADVLALTEMATIHEKQGRLHDAEVIYNKLLRVHPDRFTGYKYLILFYQRTGQDKRARSTTRQLERLLKKNKSQKDKASKSRKTGRKSRKGRTPRRRSHGNL